MSTIHNPTDFISVVAVSASGTTLSELSFVDALSAVDASTKLQLVENIR